MPDAEKIIAEALVADAHADDGWLSDAQTARLSVNTEGSVFFCGEGSIDVAHVASIAVAALREAGMLTETEWEYRAEGRNRMGHMEMRNRVEPGVIPSLVRRGYVAYRRRPSVPAGLWEPVEGDPR